LKKIFRQSQNINKNPLLLSTNSIYFKLKKLYLYLEHLLLVFKLSTPSRKVGNICSRPSIE